MIEDNHTNENNQELKLMHLFTEFSKNISVPKQVFLTEAEAELLADYFLKLIWGIEACIGHFGWSSWENHMYPYSKERVQVLLDSGLITKEYVDMWWERNPIPDDDEDTEYQPDS